MRNIRLDPATKPTRIASHRQRLHLTTTRSQLDGANSQFADPDVGELDTGIALRSSVPRLVMSGRAFLWQGIAGSDQCASRSNSGAAETQLVAVGSRGGVSVLGGCFRGAVARQEGLASVASVTEINPPEGGYLAQALQAVISIHIG